MRGAGQGARSKARAESVRCEAAKRRGDGPSCLSRRETDSPPPPSPPASRDFFPSHSFPSRLPHSPDPGRAPARAAASARPPAPVERASSAESALRSRGPRLVRGPSAAKAPWRRRRSRSRPSSASDRPRREPGRLPLRPARPRGAADPSSPPFLSPRARREQARTDLLSLLGSIAGRKTLYLERSFALPLSFVADAALLREHGVDACVAAIRPERAGARSARRGPRLRSDTFRGGERFAVPLPRELDGIPSLVSRAALACSTGTTRRWTATRSMRSTSCTRAPSRSRRRSRACRRCGGAFGRRRRREGAHVGTWGALGCTVDGAPL